MPSLFVQYASAVETATSPISVAYGSSNSVSDLLFCTIQTTSNVAPTITVTDSNGNGIWTALPQIVILAGTVFLQSFYKLNCNAGANTVTATMTGATPSVMDLIIGEWSGVSFLDQHAEGTTSVTIDPASGNTVNTHTDLAIGYAGLNSGSISWINTPDPTYTVDVVPNRCTFSSKQNIAASTYGFTTRYVTGGGPTGTAAGMATFTVSSAVGTIKTITIDHTKVGTADSTNFTMLFKGTYSFLRTVANGGSVTNASGYDITFTSDAAGANFLNWELESYDPVTGTVIFWIRIPTLSHTADTVIYMWYGNSLITGFQGGPLGAAYDANYHLVYHLNDNAANTTIHDSSAYGYNGTNHANTNTKTVAGEVGPALAYNGTNDFSSSPAVDLSATNVITISGNSIAGESGSTLTVPPPSQISVTSFNPIHAPEKRDSAIASKIPCSTPRATTAAAVATAR